MNIVLIIPHSDWESHEENPQGGIDELDGLFDEIEMPEEIQQPEEIDTSSPIIEGLDENGFSDDDSIPWRLRSAAE